MKFLQEKIVKRGIPVKVTLNSRFYIPEQYSLISEIVGNLMDIGYNTFILSDMGLLVYLKKQGFNCNIHLSGVAGVRNHLAIQQLDGLNIKRIVFPRKTQLEDMEEIINNSSDLEYEVFILNERCLSSEEYCNSLICEKVNTLCTLPHKLYWKDSDRFKEVKLFENKFRNIIQDRENILKNDERLGIRGCGLCMIQELYRVGVTHLKIVGRMIGVERICEDVSIVKELILQAKSMNNFKDDVIQKVFDNKCPVACYFMKS